MRRLFEAAVLGLLVVGSAAATDYHVGPGQTYTQIGQVPWYALQAGDTVYIHYRSTPYYEKFLISGRGTPTQWIRVLGVPGPNGELPIISGNGAITSKNSHYHWQDASGGSAIQWSGIVQIAVRADNPDGTSPPLPGYIEVANLQVQDGYTNYRFTAENGTTSNYEAFAACIYARSAQHLLIRNNVLTNCGQGFYNWTGDGSSGGSTWWDGVQIDTVLRGNYFYNNGNTGGYTEHQVYTESNGVTIENNRFGAPRAGMMGSQLKDRSAGTVIRYNYIEQSPLGWSLDLVEPQESYYTLGKLATYKQAFVYGNLMVNKGVNDPNMVHWNEDHQMGQGRATLTGGTLYFYDNTLLTVANQSDMSTYSLFNTTWGAYDCPPSKLPGVIDVRNNVIATLPRTAGSPVPTMKFGYCGTENFNFGTNWVSPGYFFGTGGTVTGTSNILSPSTNDPGFLNVGANDLHLAPGSGLAGKGGSLAAAVTSNSLGIDARATQQYVYHLQTAARASGGGVGGDLGALEGTTATGCTYSASPETAAYGADASAGTVSVTAGSSCGWSASSNAAWLGISAGGSGTGYGLVSYTVAANTGTAARTGTLSVAGSTVTITQAGQPACTYSLSATAASMAAAGGSGSVGVTSGSGCGWTAASGAAWITVSGSGTGSGTATYTVAANTTTTSRTGALTIAGQTFTITQAGQTACTYTLSTSSASVAAAGGSGSVGVTSTTGCGWTAASGAAWITVSGSGSGSGTATYAVAANTTTTSRTGTLTIAGKTFTITQAGQVACTYTLSASSASVAAAGGSGSVSVSSATGCGWTASSSAAWITVSGSGTGSGTATYTVAANTTASSRTGTLTIAGKTFTVTQAAAAAPTCTYSVTPLSATAPTAGSTLNIAVSAPTGCTWTAASNSTWISVSSGSGSGNGSLVLTVASTSSGTTTLAATTSPRTGTVTVAGSTITVSQGDTAAAGTVTFKQGANSYTGTRDVMISSLYANQSWNGGDGYTEIKGTTIDLENVTGDESRALLRFDGLSIPAGKTVASATVTLTFTYWQTAPTVLTGYYLAAPWNPASASTITWKKRDQNALWAAPGASAQGSDVLIGKSFQVGGFTAVGKQVKTITLDPQVVQAWLADPIANQGVLLTVPASSSRLSFYTSEAGTSLRPVLTISYK